MQIKEHRTHAAPKCANCKHFVGNTASYALACYGARYFCMPEPAARYCRHPSLPVSLVSGDADDVTAISMRDGDCGFDGKLFEQYVPKPTTEYKSDPEVQEVIPYTPQKKPNLLEYVIAFALASALVWWFFQ